MVKIQSQAGNSLADVYDVEGSIAGIEQLETRELGIIHELGATVFSERFGTSVRRQTSGAIAQNIEFNLVSNVDDAISRLLGVAVISDAGARVARCALLARDPVAAREIPVWVYDGTNFLTTNMEDDGGGIVAFEQLLGNVQATFLPSFIGGTDQRQGTGQGITDQIAMRGRSTGFGAGTVTITALWYIASVQLGGISSRGLPIPSW